MKKILIALCFLPLTALLLPGCDKTSNLDGATSALGAALKDIPNLSNFAVQATTAFVAGSKGVINIASTTLADGTYTVNYSLTGSNTFSGTAQLVMSGGAGSFLTPLLTSGGPTTATVNSVTSSTGATSTPPSTQNNLSNLFDSSGYMGANYTLANGTVTQFTTTDVTATLTGSLLTIQGVMWTPILTTINIADHSYSGATGVVTIGSTGSLSYGEAGSGVTISEVASSGSYTIATTSPLLTGTFSVTNSDHSTVTGTFSCANP